MVYLTFAIYLCAMYAAVGLPDITYYRYSPHFNFVPFLYMFSAWETTLLNVLLFLPLGFFLPVLWSDFKSPVKTIFFGFLITFAIELLQIFTYRATDINDLMTNTLGTAIGYCIGIITRKLFPAITPEKDRKNMTLVFGSAFFVMFFIYPFLTAMLW